MLVAIRQFAEELHLHTRVFSAPLSAIDLRKQKMNLWFIRVCARGNREVVECLGRPAGPNQCLRF